LNAEIEQSYIRRTEMPEAANKELEAFSCSVSFSSCTGFWQTLKKILFRYAGNIGY
jgi:hypothetical protein